MAENQKLSTPPYLNPFYSILRNRDLFFLAKTYWQHGEKEKARGWYDKAVQCKDELDQIELQFQDRMLLSLHLEAATLLGVKHLGRLDDRLSAVLQGAAQPKNAAARIVFAQICQMHRKDYAAATRFYGEAFAAQPPLADDPRFPNRYNAACAAALAGCGQGKDADSLDAKERARLRRLALDWLRGDLTLWQKSMDRDPAKAGPAVAAKMKHWLADTDFAGVRGPDALGRLPEAERPDWRKLWEDVEALRQKALAVAKPPAAGEQPKREKGSPGESSR